MKGISFCFLAIVMFLGSCKKVETPVITTISPEEMQTFLQVENVQLIDVRTKAEFEEGYIPGAQNIDYYSPTFMDAINKLDKEKPVFVYCKSGKRSSMCAEKMLQAGFVKIYNLDGGYSKWKHESFETEMPY